MRARILSLCLPLPFSFVCYLTPIGRPLHKISGQFSEQWFRQSSCFFILYKTCNEIKMSNCDAYSTVAHKIRKCFCSSWSFVMPCLKLPFGDFLTSLQLKWSEKSMINWNLLMAIAKCTAITYFVNVISKLNNT